MYRNAPKCVETNSKRLGTSPIYTISVCHRPKLIAMCICSLLFCKKIERKISNQKHYTSSPQHDKRHLSQNASRMSRNSRRLLSSLSRSAAKDKIVRTFLRSVLQDCPVTLYTIPFLRAQKLWFCWRLVQSFDEAGKPTTNHHNSDLPQSRVKGLRKALLFSRFPA